MRSTAALHAEIARRYKAKKAEREPVSIAALRIAELGRLYIARYGHVLPDDDAGRDDALIMAHHLAKRPDAERRIPAWLSLWAPWMTAAEVATMVTRALTKPLRWRADTLAKRLNLNEAERQRLHIVTIGACDLIKSQRIARRRERARHRDCGRRRLKGVKPRDIYEANSISRAKPWERLQMSRASWYRAGKPNP
jgi:hypothetical protein